MRIRSSLVLVFLMSSAFAFANHDGPAGGTDRTGNARNSGEAAPIETYLKAANLEKRWTAGRDSNGRLLDYTQYYAAKYCKEQGKRLPNIDELAYLGKHDPTFKPTFQSDNTNACIWSADTREAKYRVRRGRAPNTMTDYLVWNVGWQGSPGRMAAAPPFPLNPDGDMMTTAGELTCRTLCFSGPRTLPGNTKTYNVDGRPQLVFPVARVFSDMPHSKWFADPVATFDSATRSCAEYGARLPNFQELKQMAPSLARDFAHLKNVWSSTTSNSGWGVWPIRGTVKYAWGINVTNSTAQRYQVHNTLIHPFANSGWLNVVCVK